MTIRLLIFSTSPRNSRLRYDQGIRVCPAADHTEASTTSRLDGTAIYRGSLLSTASRYSFSDSRATSPKSFRPIAERTVLVGSGALYLSNTLGTAREPVQAH